MKLRRQGIVLSIRYVTTIEGKQYYQRRYPKALAGHPSLKSTHFKKRVKSPPDDHKGTIAEVEELNSIFESYVETLLSSNTEVLNELELERKARSILKMNHLEEGMGSKIDAFERDEFTQNALATGAFNESMLHDSHEKEAQSHLPKPEIVRAQEKAWTMLMEPPKKGHSSAMLSDAWEHHKKEAGIDTSQRTGKRLQAIWDNFLSYGGGDDRLCEATVWHHLRKFVEQRILDGVTLQTITRQMTTVVTALKSYCESLDLDIQITKPPIPKTAVSTKKVRSPLTHAAQHKLIDILSSEKDWKELFTLVALQTGTHPSEAKKLLRSSFNFETDPPTLLLSPSGTGKTAERERLIPLVYRAARIQELVENGALDELTSRTPDNISQQITKLLKRIQPETTAYSLRHTLAHNARAAGIEEATLAHLGGWSGKFVGSSEHMFKYGQGGADYEERIRPLAEALLRALKHLPL